MEAHADVIIKDFERIDDLQLGGLRIIQNPKWFCFGIDAVLLSDFSKIKTGDSVVEFGTGTGIVPILIAGKKNADKITTFEVQPEVAEMAKRSILLNDMAGKINVIQDDLENAHAYVGCSSTDAVVTNPPYFKSNGGVKSDNDIKMISRHEILCTLETVSKSAAQILKPGGLLYMVHRPDRLVDIIWNMKKHEIEPKEIRFVQPYADKSPNIVLIKGVRGGKSELKMRDPLVVYKPDGQFTDEIFDIYSSERIDTFGL